MTDADPREGETVRLVAWGVTIPMVLCPMALSKNGRAHWAVRHRAFHAQKDFVIRSWQCEVDPAIRETLEPWPAATMDVWWHYSTGRPPDDDNAISRVPAARDAFQAIGLVADDAHIRIGNVYFLRIKRGLESVTVSLRGDTP